MLVKTSKKGQRWLPHAEQIHANRHTNRHTNLTLVVYHGYGRGQEMKNCDRRQNNIQEWKKNT